MWWKLVSSEVCGVDADPHLVQLSCLLQAGKAQQASVSVIGGVTGLGETFTVCEEVFMPL